MSSSGVMVSALDVPVGQIQPLSSVVSSADAGITATPFVVPPSPDIEQQCRQLQDFRTCRTPESRQPPLLCSLSAVSSTHMVPWKPPEFPSSSSSIVVCSLSAESRRVRRATPCCCRRRITVCFQVWMLHSRPLRAISRTPFFFACMRDGPACAISRTGPSGAVDWDGCQDIYETAGGIAYLGISQNLGPVRTGHRSQTIYCFRWKPGIGITASSYYSALRQHRMSAVVPSPFSARLSRVDSGYCSSPLQRDDYTVVI